MVEEFAHIAASCGDQLAPAARKEIRELLQVASVSGQREARQSLLDFEVVEERRQHALVGFLDVGPCTRHTLSMRVIGHRDDNQADA